MTTERTPATWAAFFVASGIWGSTFLVISIGNDALDPVWAATLRLGLAAVVLAVFARVREKGFPRGAALRAAALYGLFGFGINFPLLYWGETVVPSGVAAVMFATMPLSSALIARALGVERLSRLRMVGAFIALGGVALLFSGELSGEVTLLPLLAVLLGATAASVGNVALKRGPRVAPFGVNAVGTAVGFLVALPVSLIAGETPEVPTTFGALFPILYLVLVASVAAYTMMAWLLNHWDASSVAFITVIIPVIALALGIAIRHERPGALSFVGAALIVGGLLLDVLATKRRAAAELRAQVSRP